MRKKKQKLKLPNGFSLIELLLVISIISFLASILLVALNNARIKARNASRSQNTQQLINAFYLGWDATGALPYITPNAACVSSGCYAGWNGFSADAATDAFLEPYIKKPADPQDTTRGYGGFLYFITFGGASPFDGSTVTGPVMVWLQEPPNADGICGGGKIWDITANYIECFYNFK